jgi:cytochrome P450
MVSAVETTSPAAPTPRARADKNINDPNREDNMTVEFADFAAAEKAGRRFEANRILFRWLSDDVDRAALCKHLAARRIVLKFQSRADTKLRPADDSDSVFHQDVYLLTARKDIERALTDTACFSNSPYQALGSGSFMLGLDPKKNPLTQNKTDHDDQRKLATAYLRHVGTPRCRSPEDKITDQSFQDYLRETGSTLKLDGKGVAMEKVFEGYRRLKDPAFGAYLREIGSALKPDRKDPAMDAVFEGYLRRVDTETVAALSEIAFLAAGVLPLKQRQFDLVELAEQAALRYAGFLFGFAQADHLLLETSMRAAYLGLNYQILGRHFVTEPGILPEATRGMGALLRRTACLIDMYRHAIGREQEDESRAISDELDEIHNYEDRSGKRALAHFVPLLQRIARSEVGSDYSGTELAVIVVGMIAGTIGNVQASVAIAVNQFFQDPKVLENAQCEAMRSWLGNAGADAKLQALIWEALRLNPPVAFLPRKTVKEVTTESGDKIPQDRVIILAMAGATLEGLGNDSQFRHDRNHHDPLIFGGPPGQGGYIHQCIGEQLAMPLIAHIVRQVLILPGLAQRLDPVTGKPLGLEKCWGFNCRSYPLEYNRFEMLKQSPLNVIMKVRTPISVHAEELKKIIKYGAPRIEDKLREARHVHFAWFEFIENDTKLVLHTVYDRDFDAYIEHFALQIGPLFDLLFAHIQDAPPRPVDKFPKEFIDTIRRYNARPAGDYFFSAYRKADVAMITQDFRDDDLPPIRKRSLP